MTSTRVNTATKFSSRNYSRTINIAALTSKSNGKNPIKYLDE